MCEHDRIRTSPPTGDRHARRLEVGLQEAPGTGKRATVTQGRFNPHPYWPEGCSLQGRPLTTPMKRGRRRRAALHYATLVATALHLCCLVTILPSRVRAQTPAPAAFDATSAAETGAAEVGAALGPLNVLLSGFADFFAIPVKNILPTSSFYTPGLARISPFLQPCSLCNVAEA